MAFSLSPEEKRARRLNAQRKYRAAIKALKPVVVGTPPDPVAKAKDRERWQRWAAKDSEGVREKARQRGQEFAARQKDRMAAALAQAVATERNVDNLTDENDGLC